MDLVPWVTPAQLTIVRYRGPFGEVREPEEVTCGHVPGDAPGLGAAAVGSLHPYPRPTRLWKLKPPMCKAVACRTCSKTTWAGCGQHVDQVLRGVPTSQRCPGHSDDASAPAGFLARLFRRR